MGFITLDDAKAQLHVDGEDQDDLIKKLIKAADRDIENVTGFVSPKRDGETFNFDRFGCELRLPLRPIAAETIEVKYLDTGGSEQTFADFRTFERHGFLRIVPAIGKQWPPAARGWAVITVTATVGFDEADAAIPAEIQHAARLKVSAWFDGDDAAQLSASTDGLLASERTRRV